jgi:hypothetical protein
MRNWLSALFLFSLLLGSGALAQEEGTPPADAEGEKKPAAEEPAEPPVFVLPERERGRLEKALSDYLQPGRKPRAERYKKLEKLVEKKIDGHSLLEDVEALTSIANQARLFNPKVGKKGRINEVKIPPDVHGFPGRIGTVFYDLYLPKGYTDRQLWPVIFCLPDNKKFPDGKTYINQRWLKPAPEAAQKFLIVVPRPQSRGDKWANAKSYARAMITLRHLLGTFEATSKTGGPAVDANRIFIEGDDVAATIAGRFSELFAGAILRGVNGIDSKIDLAKGGGLGGLPAFLIFNTKKKTQRTFAEKIKAANDATRLVMVEDNDFTGNQETVAKWVGELEISRQPRKLEYFVYDGSFQRHYWIVVRDFDASVKPAPSFRATADRARNEVRIDVEGVNRFELFLNDALVDLGSKLRIVVTEGEKEYLFLEDTLRRDLAVMLEEMIASNQPWRAYPVRLLVDLPTLRARHAEEEAARKAEEEAASADQPTEPASGK